MDDELKKMYGILKEKGHTGGDDYATFKENYTQPAERKRLFDFVKEKGYYSKEYPDFDNKYFSFEKKSPDQTVSSPASGVVAGTVSPNTPSSPQVAPTIASQVVPGELKPMSGVLSPEVQAANEQKVRETALPQEMSDIAIAQQDYIKAKQGDPEAIMRERDRNMGRYHGVSEEDKAKAFAEEDARAAESAKLYGAQPLTMRMLDHYKAKVGGEGGSFIGDLTNLGAGMSREDRAMGQLETQLKGTPLGAEVEQRLQKIYKATDPKNPRSLENAALDAKGVFLDLLGDKDNAIWDDFAKTNANFADYDPNGYHDRLNNQIKATYESAGIPEAEAYKQLHDAPLSRGVMDEDRTKEAQLVSQLDQMGEYVKLAEESGDKSRVEKTKLQYTDARRAVDVLRNQRLADVDSKIKQAQQLLVDPATTEEDKAKIQQGIAKYQAIKKGFINPNAVIEAKYALYEPQAKAALPGGTPMQQLKKLFAELEFDRRQIVARITKAEGGKGDARFAMQELANSVAGGGHNDDHARLVQLDAQIADLAPIVYLNESPELHANEPGFMEDVKNMAGKVLPLAGGVPLALGILGGAYDTNEQAKSGWGSTAWAGMLNTMGGKGSPLSSTQKQEDARELMRNLQIAGVPAEALNDPSMEFLKERGKEPGLLDRSYQGNLVGTSFGLMFHIMAAAELTRGLGLAKTFASLTKAANFGKKGTTILAMLGDAIESGVNYETAGQLSVDNKDELSFAGGFLGGAAAGLGKLGFNKASTVVSKIFGDKAGEAAKIIAGWGARRAGAGVGETFEETGQQLVQMWNQSNTGTEFWNKMKEQFGDLSEASKFVISTFTMGSIMGAGNSDGLGAQLIEMGEQELQQLSPEDRRDTQVVLDQQEEERAALEQASMAASEEQISKKQELKDEARALANDLASEALGDDERAAAEQRLQEIEDEIIGMEEVKVQSGKPAQAEQAAPFPDAPPVPEAEPIEIGVYPTELAPGKPPVEVAEATVTPPAIEGGKPTMTIETSAGQIEAPFDMAEYQASVRDFERQLNDGSDAFVDETPTAEPVQPTTEAKPSAVSITSKPSASGRGFTGDIVIEIDGKSKPRGHYTVEVHGDTAHLADIQIGYDDNERASLGKSGYGIETYKQIAADLAKKGITLKSTNFGENGTTISPQALSVWRRLTEQGLARVTGQVDARVLNRFPREGEQEWVDKQVNTYEYINPKAQDSAVVDVTGQSTGIPAQEAAPKGKETKKRKPNPNRKTKTKPAKDLTPAQTVDEVAATTIEAEENPTPENMQRAKEVEQQFEANIDTAELDAEIAAEEEGNDLILEHGTPHDFSAFDINRIGSGEGNQAFGYGLYFTSSSKIAKHYAKMLSEAGKGIVYKVRILGGKLNNWMDWRDELDGDIVDKVADLLKPLRAKYDAYYEANEAANDKPYAGIIDDILVQQKDGGYDPVQAGALYSEMRDVFGPAKATEIMVAAGIDGVRYKTKGGKGSDYNYVVFNDKSIKIESKEGEASQPVSKKAAPKSKKQELPEGVEDQFVLANVRGDRTEYRKKDGVWEKRTHKLGTKVRDQQFVRDWEEVSEEDVDYVEKMSKKTELDREVLNSAKEWVATWGNFVTGRGQMRGNAFSKVDAGLTALGLDLTSKTFKLGLAIARALAAKGMFTYENWKKDMLGATGGYAEKFLKNAWDQVTHVLPEGSTDPGIQSNVAQPTQEEDEVAEEKPKEKKKPVESSGEKTGTQKLMEKYISMAGAAVSKVIANSPMLKSVYDQKARYEEALKDVKEAIASNAVGAMMKRLTEPSTTETVDIDQFQRMILVDMYRTLSDNATEERNRAVVTGDTAAEKQAQKDLDRFLTNTTGMLNAMSANALGAGRGGAASGFWRFIGGSMDTYAMGVIDKANRAIAKAKKTANGKTLEETSKEVADNLNNEKKKKAGEIADSVDGAIENGVDQTKPKRKSSTIAGKTAAEYAELKRQAKEEYEKIRISGTMNAMLSPNGFAKTAAAAKFGYYALMEGAVTFKDWAASMKRDLADLSDQDILDIWENQINGRTLSEESKNLLREKALKSINSALASNERVAGNTDSAKETKKLRDQMAKDLAAAIEAKESIDDFKKKYGLTDEQAEDLSEAISKADQAAVDKLAGKKVKGFDPAAYLPKPKTTRTDAQKSDAKKKAETRAKVKEVIRDHFAKYDGRDLIDKLTEAGLDLEQAKKVEQAVNENAQRILAQAVAGELDHIQSGEGRRKNKDYKPPKKGGKKRTNTEILIDNLVAGDISDRFVQGLVRHKFGMGRAATAEEVKRLRDLGKAVKENEAGSVYEKMAMKELATLIDSLMPRTKTEDLSALFNGLIMSSVLNSVSTILVNPYSVTDHWFLGFAKALIDPQQWTDLFKAAFTKDGGNWALMNPLAKVLVKMAAGHKPTISGMQAFASGMKTGTTSGKYDESVMDSNPAKMLPALEREQRTAIGRFLTNPKWWMPYSHIFGKTIGRLLSATDAGMTMAYGDLEYLDALRVAIGKKPGGTIAELKEIIGEYLSKESKLWKDSLQTATDEAAAMEALTGKPVPNVTVQVRAREIVRKQFAKDNRVGLSTSELESIQMVAQYNTLTLKRQGAFGKAATVMAKLKSGQEPWQKALAVILKPFILFTEIPGNYGDALLDNTPVYNLLRMSGFSPTGIAKRLGWTETSARLGENGSRERRKQMEQAFFSNVLFAIAYLLIPEDDDDKVFGGKETNTDESYQIWGIPYKAFASLAPPLILAKVLRDAEKNPQDKTMNAPEAVYARMNAAFSALAGFYTDQSFMKGIQDFGKMVTTLSDFSKGETTGQAAFRAVIRPYLNLLAKPLPQTQGISRFILDCFDPHKYTEEDWSEMFAMTLGMERTTNEKKIGLFGEEYLQYPGYNVLNVKSLIDKAAGDHPMKKEYEFLAKTKTFIKAPANPVAKFLDPESSTGFTFREFTPKEWSNLNKKAGELFKVSLDEYIDSEGESFSGNIGVAGNKLISQTQADILQKWSDARKEAKAELFGDILLSDTEAQMLIDEKFPANE